MRNYMALTLMFILHRRLRGGNFVGEIYAAEELSPLQRPGSRVLAFVDESSIAGSFEPDPSPSRWRFGATKAFAIGIGLEALNLHPYFVADPCSRQRAYSLHQPSARAVDKIQSHFGWTRRVFEYNRETQNADLGLLTLASSDPRSIIVTGLDTYREHRSRFPWLTTDEGKRRIHRAVLNGDRIEVPTLGISEVIPMPLFNQAAR